MKLHFRQHPDDSDMIEVFSYYTPAPNSFLYRVRPKPIFQLWAVVNIDCLEGEILEAVQIAGAATTELTYLEDGE